MRQSTVKTTLLLTFLLVGFNLQAAELLMVEEEGCVYCAKFNREIAPAYPKTAEGRVAPLRRLSLTEPWPEDLQEIARAQVTPTFILVDKGREVDRLIGYPGDEHFWFLLGDMLEKL
ncbi:MAG: transcriptional regulator [Granulosicoccus sp.]|nr:transcriptional regulator [Granulosicoccus sp.]